MANGAVNSPFQLSETDAFILTQTDEEFVPHTWEEMKTIIVQAEDRFDLIRRWPSNLRQYIQWSIETKQRYGDSKSYILQVLLKWPKSVLQPQIDDTIASSGTFENADDYKVVFTEWPYGLELGMKHIIVWMRRHLQIDPISGRLTPKSRLEVHEFVEKYFLDRLRHLPGEPEDKVQWGRSWGKFQSVPGIEHFHIFVRDVPDDLLRKLTSEESWPWLNRAEERIGRS